MEFFGIGILELIVIAVLALIVVGPERLPEVMVKVARFIQDFRAYSANITSEFSSAIEEMQAEFKDVTDATNESIRTINQDLNAVNQSPYTSPAEPATATTTETTNGSTPGVADTVTPQEKPVTEPEPAAVANSRVASLDEIRRRVLHSSNGVESNGAGPGITHDDLPSNNKNQPDKPEA